MLAQVSYERDRCAEGMEQGCSDGKRSGKDTGGRSYEGVHD